MAHRKAGGTARSFRDSNPQYLGTKKYGGEKVQAGNIIVRQRGTKILAGANTDLGSDHTIYATKDGLVVYGTKRVQHFDGTFKVKKTVSVQ